MIASVIKSSLMVNTQILASEIAALSERMIAARQALPGLK